MQKMTAKKREQTAQKLINKVYLNQHEKAEWHGASA